MYIYIIYIYHCMSQWPNAGPRLGGLRPPLLLLLLPFLLPSFFLFPKCSAPFARTTLHAHAYRTQGFPRGSSAHFITMG